MNFWSVINAADWEEKKKLLPFADTSEGSIALKGLQEGHPVCMRCGDTLADYSNMKKVRGEWVPRKTKGNEAQWVCLNVNCEIAGIITPLALIQAVTGASILERIREARKEGPVNIFVGIG